MSRAVSLGRALRFACGGAVLTAAALAVIGLPACNAFLEDFVYADGGSSSGADGSAGGDGGTDATTSPDASASTDGAPGGDASDDDANGDDGGPGPNAYRDSVLAASPIAYWRFGESEGTTAHSLTGLGQYAAVYTGVDLGVPGAIDSDPDTAIHLDGTMGVVRYSGGFAAIDSEIFAVEMWVRPTAPTTDLRFLLKSIDFTTLAIYTDGPAGASFHAGETTDSVSVVDDSAVDLILNDWNYVVLQSDGVQLTLSLNLVAVAMMPTLGPSDASVTTEFNMGGDENGYSTFDGDLDEVAVYPEPLTLKEMKLHYALAGAHDAGP